MPVVKENKGDANKTRLKEIYEIKLSVLESHGKWQNKALKLQRQLRHQEGGVTACKILRDLSYSCCLE